MLGVFHDLGIRFEYPASWELLVDEEDARSTITLNAPGGTAFALVTVDDDRPAAQAMADEALDAMREEYPDLEACPAAQTIAGRAAVGHDLEFFSLDFVVACTIRCYRTPQHTVLLLAQWADTGEDPSNDDPDGASTDFEAHFARLCKSFEDTAAERALDDE
jgi:hypothetical protein